MDIYPYKQNRDFDLRITAVDHLGEPIDVTGATGRIIIKEILNVPDAEASYDSSTQPSSGFSIEDGPEGKIKLTVPRSWSVVQNVGEYKDFHADIEITLASGKVIPSDLFVMRLKVSGFEA